MSVELRLYKCRGYLFCLYTLCEMSCGEIGKKCGVCSTTINYWLRKFQIPRRSQKEAQKISQNRPEVKKKMSESAKLAQKINQNRPEVKAKKSGKNNPMWIENWEELGNNRKHVRIRRMLEKMGIFRPLTCPICGGKHSKKKLDLVNIDHRYKKNPLDYYYMCSNCHVNKYHYLSGLVEGHKTIKPIPNLIKNLLQLKTREEREQALKDIITHYMNYK